jgi:predicted Rossmann-fold nucleotide-binding protein
MGMVADATLAAGGRVVGVIPKALVEKEWATTDCTELHIVDTMHERKRMMAERADAFPGAARRHWHV